MTSVIFTAEIFPEGDVYVGLCRELDVSSFGDSPDEAKASLQEAVETFLEGCGLLGTLRDVLEESGFEKTGGAWRLRKRMTVREVATVGRIRRIVPIRYEKLVRIFELDGFQVRRTRGDHVMMTKLGVRRPLVIKSALGRSRWRTSSPICARRG